MPRRHRAREAAIATLLVATALTVSAPASANAPALSIDKVQPLQGSALAVSRVAAPAPGQPDLWKLKAEFWLHNKTGTLVNLSQVQLEYSSGPTTMSIVHNENFAINEVRIIEITDGFSRSLLMPLPATVRVHFWLSGYRTPATFLYNLAEYTNQTPLGSYFFPAKASDLAPGEYWAWKSQHVYIDNWQGVRYAHDLDIRKLDPQTGEWSKTKPGTPVNLENQSNEDYYVWDKPLYAMASGTIKRCVRSLSDQDPGVSIAGDGNSLWIQHGPQEYALYAHLRNITIPAALCPQEGVWGIDVPISAGQYIGRVGNTGGISNPHLHVQVQKGIPEVFGGISGDEDGVPLTFHNLRIRAGNSKFEEVTNPPSLYSPATGVALHRFSLILPNPCGFTLSQAGLNEVARHGVPAECWEDVVNMMYSAGYRPVFVDAFNVGSAVYFNGVFRTTTTTTVARHGLDGAAYQAEMNKWIGLGFRLHQVDSYLVGSTIRYAAIFTQRPGPQWVAYHGRTATEHQSLVSSLTAQGHVPVNISVVSIGGVRSYTALYEKLSSGSFVYYIVPLTQYQDLVDSQYAAGRQIAHLDAHTHNGVPYMTGIFYSSFGGHWAATHDQTDSGYQTEWEYNVYAATRLTRAVTGYEVNGAARYAGLWRSMIDTTILTKPASPTWVTDASFNFSATQPGGWFECQLDGAPFSICAPPTSYTNMSAGNHAFSVRARDRDGVTDPTPAWHVWEIDVTPPVVSFIRPQPGRAYIADVETPGPAGPATVIGPLTVRATAVDADSGIAMLRFSVGTVEIPAADVSYDPATSTYSFVWHPPAAPKTHTINVKATNHAGLQTTKSVLVTATSV